MEFKQSEIAHKYLDGLKGIEIGGSFHNQFGLNTINVDLNSYEHHKANNPHNVILKVDVVSPGNKLPFKDNGFDFVINSHVLEHFYDPIGAMIEWRRVATKYVFMIIPHKERTFDKDRHLTTVKELIDRHNSPLEEYQDKHWSVWTPTNFMELMDYLGYEIELMQETDDKVGNGFTVIIKI